MRLSSACLIALCTLAAPALSAESGSRAPVEKTFLIPASEGYGVGECLTSPGSECGQVVADAWCGASPPPSPSAWPPRTSTPAPSRRRASPRPRASAPCA